MLPIGLTAFLHPLVVAPLIAAPAGNDRTRTRAQFVALSVRIGLQKYLAGMTIADLVFVNIAGLQICNEDFPYAAAASHPHGVAPAIPAIEIPHHADTFRIGRPHRKTDAGYSVNFMFVRTEETIGMTVFPRAVKMKIEIRQLRRIGVRIVCNMFVVVRVAPDQPIMFGDGAGLAPIFKKVASRKSP